MYNLIGRMTAVLVAVSLVIAVVVLTGQPVYADGDKGDLSAARICFDGDSEYDYWHFYSVDGKTGRIDDLKITLLDEKGNLIDSAEYDLVIEHTWWDDNEEKDCYEKVTAPYGLSDRDLSSGFTEFRVQAVAKEEGNWSGTAESHFVIIDNYSLNWICADISFDGFSKKEGWRMYDRFEVPGDKLADPVVRRHDGVLLVKDRDYTLDYYKIDADKNMDDPSVGFEEILIADEAHHLSGLPKESGTYFVNVHAVDPYYGDATIVFDVNGDPVESWEPAIEAGTEAVVGGSTIKVISTKSKTVTFTKAKNTKAVTVPATVKLADGKTYKVTQIGAKAFTGKKIRTITISKNVKAIKANALKSSKATKLVIKTKTLTKSSVKNSLKGSAVKTIQVKVGTKSENKKYIKKYKTFFAKNNSGKKVTVK